MFDSADIIRSMTAAPLRYCNKYACTARLVYWLKIMLVWLCQYGKTAKQLTGNQALMLELEGSIDAFAIIADSETDTTTRHPHPIG